MRKNAGAATKRAPAGRRAIRPAKAKEPKLERIVARVDPKVLARAKKMAREEGFASVSAWAAWVLTAASKPEGRKAIADVPSVRPGKISKALIDQIPLRDDGGAFMRALRAERGR